MASRMSEPDQVISRADARAAGMSTYHVDHIVPLSKGGEHQEWNLVIACAPCNLAKGACDAAEFLDRIMMHHDSWPEA